MLYFIISLVIFFIFLIGFFIEKKIEVDHVRNEKENKTHYKIHFKRIPNLFHLFAIIIFIYVLYRIFI